MSIVGGQLRDEHYYEKLKLFFLTASFFFIIGSYTITRELKNSIFVAVVGRDYVPYVNIGSMLFLVPFIIFYSKLVDKMRRYGLLCFYAGIYGALGLCFAYFAGHPTIGLNNTNAAGDRLFGWLFYFFVEGYSPFVLSVFWAFANSVNNPESAKKNYGLIAAGSKLGGMFTASLAWFFLKVVGSYQGGLYYDVLSHQILLLVAAVSVLMTTLCIYLMMKRIPGRYLHGYEAAYLVEKEREDKGAKEQPGLFEGLWMMIKYPYVMGIFFIIFFYETIGQVVSYHRVVEAHKATTSLAGMSSILMVQGFWGHLLGFVISFFGTRALLRSFGERLCLMLVPLLVGGLLLYFIVVHTPLAIMIVSVSLKAINYAFSWPVREGLYIPTVKTIKFKSKSWVDSFGAKFGKASGSFFNMGTARVLRAYPSAFLSIHSIFFAAVIAIWFMIARLLGRRFEKAIKNNEVIGASE